MTNRRDDIPDFYASAQKTLQTLGHDGAAAYLDAPRKFDLAPTLRAGGAIIFGHLDVSVMGPHYAEAVHACMQSGAKLVLGVGVLHALTQDLQDARVRVAAGADPTHEPSWGIQGPGLDESTSKTNWHREFSMLAFSYFFEVEAKRRRERHQPTPELIVRYPYLAGGRPHLLPGIAELREMVKGGAVVVGTADPFHHGLAYGDPAETALPADERGLALCRKTVQNGFDMLGAGDYWGFNQHCVQAKSDGREMGQVVRYILGKPLAATIHDIAWDDMSGPYGKPSPSWVAGCLITLTPREPRESDLH